MEYSEQQIQDGTGGVKTLSDVKINLRTDLTPAQVFESGIRAQRASIP